MRATVEKREESLRREGRRSSRRKSSSPKAPIMFVPRTPPENRRGNQRGKERGDLQILQKIRENGELSGTPTPVITFKTTCLRRGRRRDEGGGGGNGLVGGGVLQS